jgi:hypothetical protein
MRQMLTAGKRGIQFRFAFRERADFEMTLLWRHGDSLGAALDRLHAIQGDTAAGRAERDSMLPEFEGLDDWITARAARRFAPLSATAPYGSSVSGQCRGGG